MTNYDINFLYDKLYSMNLAMTNLVNTIYEIENFTDDELPDEIKMNFTNITNSIQNIKLYLENAMVKFNNEKKQ